MSVFISYSWDSEPHKAWVRDLATRLRSDGIDVMLDAWAAVPGDRLPEFMERAIRENGFVVIICTPRYKVRSDGREGGVGYEGDIMTAEVMTKQNHRKFIPVLRSGEWSDAAPSWLAGKYHINLSGNPYSAREYEDLARTLLGMREEAPPMGKPLSTLQPEPPAARPPATEIHEREFEDIRITRVIVEEVAEPRNDGTYGSALYSVPFALTGWPPKEWSDLFVRNWDHPPLYTSMHRPGIASVRGSTVRLGGTTIDEVVRYHRDTLQLVLDKTNQQYREWRHRADEQHKRDQAAREQHRRDVDEGAKRIKFD